MKTIPIITFFLCTVMYAHAQLNIVPKNDGLKEYTVTNAHPYDSLTNVEKRSFTSLPGQTLYMHGVKNDRNGYWDAFYTVNFLTGDDRTVYKAVNISTTPSKEVVGKYYEVVKVWTKTDYLSAGCCLLLREKESGDEMYYNPFRYPLSMTCIGYYEKLKRFVGQTFLSLAKAVETEDGQVITPAEGAEYRCVDIGLKMNSDGAFLLMEGADGVHLWRGHRLCAVCLPRFVGGRGCAHAVCEGAQHGRHCGRRDGSGVPARLRMRGDAACEAADCLPQGRYRHDEGNGHRRVGRTIPQIGSQEGRQDSGDIALFRQPLC